MQHKYFVVMGKKPKNSRLAVIYHFPHSLSLVNHINIKQIDFPRSSSDAAHKHIPYFTRPYISCGMLALDLSTGTLWKYDWLTDCGKYVNDSWYRNKLSLWFLLPSISYQAKYHFMPKFLIILHDSLVTSTLAITQYFQCFLGLTHFRNSIMTHV